MSKQPHKSMTLEWRGLGEYKREKLWTDIKRKQEKQIKQPHHTKSPVPHSFRLTRLHSCRLEDSQLIGERTIQLKGKRGWDAVTELRSHAANTRSAITHARKHRSSVVGTKQGGYLHMWHIYSSIELFQSSPAARRSIPAILKNRLHLSCILYLKSFLYSSPHSLLLPALGPSSLYVHVPCLLRNHLHSWLPSTKHKPAPLCWLPFPYVCGVRANPLCKVIFSVFWSGSFSHSSSSTVSFRIHQNPSSSQPLTWQLLSS